MGSSQHSRLRVRGEDHVLADEHADGPAGPDAQGGLAIEIAPGDLLANLLGGIGHPAGCRVDDEGAGAPVAGVLGCGGPDAEQRREDDAACQLSEMTGRPTRIGAPGLQPQPGELLLAPGDAHMTLVRTGPVIHVRLERKRAVSGCMPSVDPMLASIGKVYGPTAVGVILSGMGRDGLEGAGELVSMGGSLLAQDEATSVVWGMPGAVANARLAHAVLPPDELARRIAAWSEGDAAWT